jgi:hypothetical protein
VVDYPFLSDDLVGEYVGVTAISGAAPAGAGPTGPLKLPSYVQLGGSNTDDSPQLPTAAIAPPSLTGLTASNATEALVTTSWSYSSTWCGQSNVPAETALLYTTTDPASWSSCQVLPLKGFGEQPAVLATGKVIVTAPSDDGKLLLWEQGDATPRTIDPGIGPIRNKAAIATYWDGSATIAYEAYDATTDRLEIREVTISSVGSVSDPVTLSQSNANAAESPQVAYAPDGTTHVVWSQTDANPPSVLETGVFASYRLPGGDFLTTPQTVINGLTSSHRAQIAVAPDGSVTLVAQINDGGGSRIAAFTHANPAAPKNIEPPKISAPNGTNAAATITCSTGTWTASPTSYLFEWLIDGRSLGPGAASSSHVITAAELGHS